MQRIWYGQYQQGVPHEIEAVQDESLLDLFHMACEKYSSNIAYVNMGTALTFSALNKLSRYFAAYLQQDLKLQKGDRVAIMMPNVLQYPIALFAILRAGLIVVNTNPLYTADEIVYQMNDSGAKAIITLANFARTIETALPKIPNLKNVVITEIADLFPWPKRLLINSIIKYVKHLVPKYNLPQAISFNRALHLGKRLQLKNIKMHATDIAFLQYTGGTTGVSKGAMLTHKNMLSNIRQAQAWLKPLHLNDKDIIVTAIPLYHIFSLTANCLTFFAIGAKNILITNPRDITHFIKEIKNTKFTAITGVNTLFNALLNHPDFKQINFDNLKLALAGGMALHKNVAMAWRTQTQKPILEAYGLTETSPAVTINPLQLNEYNGSIGLPVPSTDISIRDNDGNEVAIGEIGELCIRGPQVMSGYWQQPTETAITFWQDGFLRTGDIAKIDDKGFIYIVDRKKDMINVSGFNVYPNEVEQVIHMHPGVLEVGVIGVADPDSGETVKACIVRRDPNLTAEQIIVYCRQHLTAYKVPKSVQFYDELPKTNVGKILRRALS